MCIFIIISLSQFSDGVWVANLEEEEEDLSLILTSQNPARIDVRTLRKKKVRRNTNNLKHCTMVKLKNGVKSSQL